MGGTRFPRSSGLPTARDAIPAPSIRLHAPGSSARQQSGMAHPHPAAAATGPALAGKRILLVDDNEPNLELLAAYLEPLGCELRCQTNPDAVTRDVAAFGPDLVVLDVMMPRVSGFQVCKRLRADPATRGLPILILTALSEASDVERAREVGADGFLTKPVEKGELIEHVLSLIGAGRSGR